MISLIITFFLIAPFLSFHNEDSESQYFTYACSLAISYSSLGLLGLSLIILKLTFIPLYIILTFLFIVFILRKEYRHKLIFLCNQILIELRLLNNLQKYKKTLKFFYLLIILLFLVSIGPINHVDTVNIYVGYPYKFKLYNSHFFDGNLMQGLMGIGDFSNLFYFQEKTTWLIRTSQFIPLFFVFMFMLKRNISNIFIFVFLTSPVMIQWLTIGKNNFLSESCLVLAFLVWEKNREKQYLPYIFCLSFIAISFKISSILISIPILFYIAYQYKKSIIQLNIQKIIKAISLPIIFSLITLISIFIYRYYFIENPFYPLFAKIFNPGDQQLSDWEQTLRGWDREGLFPIWIFLPKSIGKISFVLGPANLLFFFSALIIYFRNLFLRNVLLSLGLFQFFLLIIFSQGRADYYMAPLIMMNFATSKISFREFNFLDLKFKDFINTFFSFGIFLQLIMFLISSLYSISLVLYVIYNYEEGMNKTAYNFYNSKKIDQVASIPVYSEVTGMTHLFFDKPFIANQKFERCFYYGKNLTEDQKYKYCMKKEGVKTIIIEKNKLENSPLFSCKKDSLIRASRNIFLEKKIEADFCELK